MKEIRPNRYWYMIALSIYFSNFLYRGVHIPLYPSPLVCALGPGDPLY